MRKLLFLFLFLILLSFEVNGQLFPVTINKIHYIEDVADGTDISARINDTLANCVDNDVIVLPKGKFIISDKIVVSTKDVSMIGQGADSVSGTMLYRHATASDEFILYWDVRNSEENPVFVTGIYLKGRPSAKDGSVSVADQDLGIKFQNVHNFYFTDNTIQYTGEMGVYVIHEDSITSFNGVIFNNNFLDLYRPEIGNLGYGVAIGTNQGKWITDPEFGSNKFVFIEDNYFLETRHAVTSGACGKYVFRYNTIDDNYVGQVMDAHGAGNYGNIMSTRAVEIYNNTTTTKYDINRNLITNVTPSNHYTVGIDIRGGEAIIHDNVMNNSIAGLYLWLEQLSPGTYPDNYPSPYQVGYASGLLYGVSDTLYKADHGNGDVFAWNNKVTNEYVRHKVYTIDAGSANWIKFWRDVDTVPKLGYAPYPFPHPYRSYYYSFLNSLQVKDSQYGGTLSTVTASNLTDTSVTLTWTNVLVEDGYHIYGSTDNVNFTLYGTTEMNVITKSITGLTEDKQYWFYVVPYNDSHEGQKSKTITIKINPLIPVNPVYVSSAVENVTPSRLEMNYNLSLANVLPNVTSFIVHVNSVIRVVNAVAISETKVLLTLGSPIAYGDIVTIAYTKPSTNPLQTIAGGQAETIATQTVTNMVTKTNTPLVVVVTSPESSFSGFVNEVSAGGSYDADKDNLTYTWSAPVSVPLSSTFGTTIKFLGPIVNEPTTVEFTVSVSNGKTTQSKVIPVEILPYKPDLDVAEVSGIEASSYLSPNYPNNIIDGNIGTMWVAEGIDQWLVLELKEPFSIQNVKLAFQPGQRRKSYFDVLGSADKNTWEPVLTKSASCDFSGDLQVFDFPASKAEKEFRYVKLAGQGNSTDSWNYISEMKIYGFKHKNPSFYENLAVKLYPNPAKEIINIRIDDPILPLDFIRIVDLAGKIVFNDKINPDIKEFQIPLNLKNGIYIVQMGSDNLTLYASKLIVSSK